MSALFGYFDPHQRLPVNTAQRMARALTTDPRCRMTHVNVGGLCIGSVGRGIFPGTGRPGGSDDDSWRYVFQGAVSSFSGEDVPTDPKAAAQRCFGAPFDDAILASACGSFTAAGLNTGQRAVEIAMEIAVDRAGSYPLYYAKAGDVFVFAGQLKGLLATGVLRPTLDPVAVAQMLSLGWLAGQRTLLEGVHMVPPGSVVRFTTQGVKTRRYARYAFGPPRISSLTEAVELIAPRLRTAVRRAHASGARIGVPLSGGLDSRTLLALSPDPSSTPSFTFGIPGCRDMRYAARIAHRLGSPHQAYPVDGSQFDNLCELGVWLCEGEMGIDHYHILPHTEAFSRSCDAVLDGIGGGNLLGGSYIKSQWLMAESAPKAAQSLWDVMAGDTSTGLAQEAALTTARCEFLNGFAEAGGDSPMDQVMAFLLENRTRRFSGSGARLLRHRVEVLSPFFDNDLVAAIAQVPHHLRKRQRLYAALVTNVAPKVASVGWQHTGLPVSLPYPLTWLGMAGQKGIELTAQRLGLRTCFPRREMSDCETWFRGPMRPWIESVLLDQRTCDRAFAPADVIRSTVANHMSGRGDHANRLGALLAIEIFCRLFLDDFDASVRRFAPKQEALV